MAGTVKRIDQFDPLVNGSSGETNLKLSDKIPAQHVDIPSGKNKTNNLNVGQLMCQPVASCAAQQSGGIYSATCVNFPDFSLTYTDKDNNPITLVGMKVRVVFTYACNYGSTSDGTYPQLRINNSSAKPMLAQGKPMATGAWSAGQCLEFTLIPYGSDYAWDCDSNVREVTSSYTVYADGTITYNKTGAENAFPKIIRVENADPFSVKDRLLEYISILPIGISILEIRGYDSLGYGNIRTVIFVNKRSDTVFSYIATQNDNSPSMTSGLRTSGVWYA